LTDFFFYSVAYYSYVFEILLTKAAFIFDQKYGKIVKYDFNFKKLFSMSKFIPVIKAEFSASVQSSVSHDPSEITLI